MEPSPRGPPWCGHRFSRAPSRPPHRDIARLRPSTTTLVTRPSAGSRSSGTRYQDPSPSRVPGAVAGTSRLVSIVLSRLSSTRYSPVHAQYRDHLIRDTDPEDPMNPTNAEAPDQLTRTRTALHAVAEVLVAGPQYAAHGDIRLTVLPDGFAGWVAGAAAVAGTDLVTPTGRTPIAGRLADLASAAGIDPRRLTDVY